MKRVTGPEIEIETWAEGRVKVKARYLTKRFAVHRPYRWPPHWWTVTHRRSGLSVLKGIPKLATAKRLAEVLEDSPLPWGFFKPARFTPKAYNDEMKRCLELMGLGDHPLPGWRGR